MNQPKRPLKVFLCHAHADRDAVRALYTRLTNDGVDAWLDKAKLLPGQDWELEIRKAVRAADVVVVCLSKQFNQAGFRQKEVRLALDTAMEKPEGEIFIIPARLEDCDNLDSLRKWHWVDLFENDGYEILMRALRVRADKTGKTLQIKKSWLPIGNTRPVVTKQSSKQIEKHVEKKYVKTNWKKKLQTLITSNKKLIGITSFIIVITLIVIPGSLLFNEILEKPTFTATSTDSFVFTQIPVATSTLPTVYSTASITPTNTPPSVLLGGTEFSLSQISLSNIEQLELLSTIYIGEKDVVDSDISPDGKLLVAVLKEIALSGVSKYSIQAWDFNDGTSTFSLDTETASANSVLVRNDGFYYSVCTQGYFCSDAEIFFVDTDNWQPTSKGKVEGEILALSQDGNLAAVKTCTKYQRGWRDTYYCAYEKMKFWDVSSSTLSEVGDEYGYIGAAAISFDNKFMVFYGINKYNECSMQLVELSNLDDVTTLYQKKSDCWFGEIYFLPDNKNIVGKFSYQDTTTQIISIPDGALISSGKQSDTFSSSAFSYDGSILVTTEFENIFNGTMLENVAKQVNIRKAQDQSVLRIVEDKADFAYFSFDNLLIITISNQDHALKIWGIRNP
jgi:hypothetical protein